MSLQDCIKKRLLYRSRITTTAQANLEREVCRRDVVHWVNHWCWTYDPREAVTLIPFDLFPRQAEFLRWLTEREEAEEDGLVEKSRDMGATWLCCAYAVHRWLFREGYSAGFGSRKLELVDKKGDPDCIFEKMRFILQNLPPWMLPKGWSENEHACYTKIINPENESTITGEGGDNIGRGGRKSIYFVDESAFLERPGSVDRSLSQTTRCRIDVSTPNGPGNPFFTRRFSGKVKVFTFNWRDDPRKGEAWYKAQKEKLDAVTLAQEVDIDYTASIEGICIPAAWVRAAVDLELPASDDVMAGLDIGEEGDDASVFIPRRGPRALPAVVWRGLLTTASAYRAADEAEKCGAKVVRYDCIGIGAGVKSTYASTERKLTFTPEAVNVGEAPTDTKWPDGKTSKERFLNLRAELWWMLRVRFEKAYEYRELGVQHPPEDMISIPNDQTLIGELSTPLLETRETGKIALESKANMRRRGVKSPNHGDALALAFFPGKHKRKAQWW